MTTAESISEEEQWRSLYAAVGNILDRLGKRNAFREGDFWLLDDDWGQRSQQIEIQNLDILQPETVQRLQRLLFNYPDWYITIRIDVPGTEESWPGMGLIVYADEVVDELLRDFLPLIFADMRF